MPFTTSGKNLMLDYFGTQNLYMALYSDDAVCRYFKRNRSNISKQNNV